MDLLQLPIHIPATISPQKFYHNDEVTRHQGTKVGQINGAGEMIVEEIIVEVIVKAEAPGTRVTHCNHKDYIAKYFGEQVLTNRKHSQALHHATHAKQ